MKIMTFPLKYVESDLKKIGTFAKNTGMTKEQFIKSAVDEKMERIVKERDDE